MMNPDEGLVRKLTESFTEDLARKQGFTEKFYVGEIIQIKGIYFKVLNFVEEYNTMNLQCVKTKEALRDLADEAIN